MVFTALIGLFGIGGGLIDYISAQLGSFWRNEGARAWFTSDIVGVALILVVYFYNLRRIREDD